jgi:hypothetical protein
MKNLFLLEIAFVFRLLKNTLFISFIALTDMVGGLLSSQPSLAAPPPGWTPPPTELLIIVPYKEPSDVPGQENEDWISVGRELRNYKYTTGLGAVLKTLNDINRDYEGRDEPERIKRAIYEYALDPGIKYVMLVGDAELMPTRYQYHGYTRGGATFYSSSEGYCSRYCDDDGPPCTTYCSDHPDYCDEEGNIRWCPAESYGFVPNDGYYSNLWDDDDHSREFDNWDSDGDRYFGELYRDNIRGIDRNTIHPDVAVGRVPARTPEEFSTFIEKIMAYEDGSDGMRRSEAYHKALLTSGFRGATTHRRLGDELGGAWEITYLEQQDDSNFRIQGAGVDESTGAPAEFIIDFVNANTPHFLGYGGHGNRNCWCEVGFGWRHAAGEFAVVPPEGWLANDLPTIAAAASCSTAKFADSVYFMDPAPEPVSTSTIRRSMAGPFLTRSRGGAVVYVGSVVSTQGGAHELERYFFRAIRDGARAAGDAWRNALDDYIASHGLDTLTDSGWHEDTSHPDGGYWSLGVKHTFDHIYKMLFFGDPSLRRNGEESWDDSPATTRAVYERRVHIDPAYRYQRILFDATDRESGVLSTRYRYRIGKSWTPWLSGSEFYLPLPSPDKKPQLAAGKQVREADVEYYSVDRSGNREQVKTARIAYEYTSTNSDITAKSHETALSNVSEVNSSVQPSKINVRGKVVNRKGMPLRATLKLKNKTLSREAQTDAQGWYIFSDISVGTYTLGVTQIPPHYRQFVPEDSSYEVTVKEIPVKRSFVFVRDDHVAPTMTQELPWNAVAKSGCAYGLAYDDWYGTGVEDVKIGINDIKNRWLSPKETWVDKEIWFTPQHVMTLSEFLESPLNDTLSKHLPKDFQKTEQAQLESVACRLAADCKPLVWMHCFGDPIILGKGWKIIRGKVKDKRGNSSEMEAMNVEVVADFEVSPVEGSAPFTVQFTNKSRGNVIDVEWDFGDGEGSMSFHPTHTYKTHGTYKAMLSMSGPYGWQTITKEIRVAGRKAKKQN